MNTIIALATLAMSFTGQVDVPENCTDKQVKIMADLGVTNINMSKVCPEREFDLGDVTMITKKNSMVIINLNTNTIKIMRQL